VTLQEAEQQLGPWKVDQDVKRIICHWTAGQGQPNEIELRDYHYLISQDLKLYHGRRWVGAPWPQHTRGLNTGSIGLALCGMAGATLSDHGKWPLTAAQLDRLCLVAAALLKRYHLPLTEESLLVHADVTRVYGIEQRGKWDISVWPGRPLPAGTRAAAQEVSHLIRLQALAYLPQTEADRHRAAAAPLRAPPLTK
jgi:hypothetical protein